MGLAAFNRMRRLQAEEEGRKLAEQDALKRVKTENNPVGPSKNVDETADENVEETGVADQEPPQKNGGRSKDRGKGK